MKINIIVLSILSIILLSCGNDTTTVVKDTAENQNIKPTITAQTIKNLKYLDYALSTEAKKAVSNWEKYQELAIQINYLKKADLSFFNGDETLLKSFIKTFKTTVPKVLQTNAVESRTMVLETKILKLHDDLTLNNITTSVQLMSIKDVFIAFSNFNFQVNKKLESDFYKQIQP
ncbi:MAG: hypothetical protein ACPGUH_09205 [Winogradskyella sp.]